MKQFLLVATIVAIIVNQHPALSQLMPVQEESTTAPPPPKNATYWITMGSSIRPGQALELKVEILAGKDPVTVTVSIRTYDGNKTLVSGSPAVVLPGGVQSIYVNIPENIKALSNEEYLYNLNALVVGEGKTVQFKHEVMLTFREKFISVFVQTDKAIYKAGQIVKFRILSMTPDLKVIRNNSNDVLIKDSKDNKIQQWLGVSDPNQRGVVELSLRLAANVPTGDWSIIVKTKGTETIKTFTVDNYVLPKYEVKVNTPPFCLTSDPTLKTTIQAMYTYGQPVRKATADVVIQMSYYYSSGTQPQIKITGSLNNDGEFTFQVSQKQLLDLATKSVTWGVTDLNYQRFKISANVTETDTGRVQSGNTDIMCYSSPLKMNFLEISPSNYKPGLNYTGYLEVKKKDDTLFTDAESRKISLLFNVTYTVKLSKEELEKLQNQSYIDNAGTNSSSDGVNKLTIMRPMWPYQQTKTFILSLDHPIRNVPDNGLIPISFSLPMEAESATIEARCLEPFPEESTSKYINKMNSPSNSYLQLQVPTERPKVGSTIKVIATSTVNIMKLYYQVYSKGKLLLSNAVVSAENSQTVEFSITVTQDMATKLNIIAYFIADKTEFVVDGLSLSVDGTFPKPVSVEFSKSIVKPGEQVDVVVKAEKDSMVYLLSNDKSVQLLKSGNDLTQEVVQNELIQYDYGGYSMWRYMFFCGWPSYFGGNNAISIFQNAGIEVLTDGLIDWRSDEVSRDILLMAAPGINKGMSEDVKSSSNDATFQPADVRKFFPEVWLWTSLITDSNGQAVTTVTAPDTITTWVTTAFSTHPEYGLSVVKESANLTTFKEMFVSLDLPFSIIRGEDFCLTATVFSYCKCELPVLLTLDKSKYFSNIHVKLDGGQVTLSKESLYYSYFLGYLKENETISSKYCFTPNVIGDIPVKVSALTNVAGLSDAVEQNITVKAEGVPRTTVYSYLIDLSSGKTDQTFPVKFPSASVPGSKSVTVNVAVNILGPMFDNLNNLIRRPYGCGEQNMLNFAPNIFALQFSFSIKSSNSSPNILNVEQVKENLLIGYQTEITYEHTGTGGFSTFGSQDSSPSLWLSSYVLNCFSSVFKLDQIQGNIITIDKMIIYRTAKWIISQQNANGSFTEYGKVYHKEMQGGSGEGEALTAYTLIALNEAVKLYNESETALEGISKSIELATSFLGIRLPFLSDPYDICIVTYALHIVNHNSKDAAFSKMENIALVEGNMKYWKRSSPVQTDLYKYEWSASADSISVEATAYALLTYDLRNKAIEDTLPIVRWLISNKGPNGGFRSSQDTVIGLQSLSTVARKFYNRDEIPMTITVSYDNVGTMSQETIKINKTNEMLLQSVFINYQNESPKAVNISAKTDDGRKGPSAVIAEVVLEYNILNETKPETYDMTHNLLELPDGLQLTISVKTVQTNSSSMTILEVDIPPGYSPDLDSLKANEAISLQEIKSDQLIIYFNSDVITTKGVTVKIWMFSSGGKLTKSLPRTYRVYDYYQPDKEQTKNYNLPETDFCTNVPDVGLCQYIQTRPT